MVKDLVSIIIPAYNHERYIGDLLNSILQQNYDNMEVLICDDCSQDMTYQIALKYKDKMADRGIQYVVHKNDINQGMCRTLNYLLDISQGEYIKPIASDDFFADTEAIGSYVRMFKEERTVDTIVANCYLVNSEASYPLEQIHVIKKFYENAPVFEGINLTDRLYIDNYICAPTLMYRKHVTEQIGKYDEAITFEDWDFNLRMSEHNIHIKYYDVCTVAYRQVAGSQAHSHTEEGYIRHLTGQLQTLEKHENYICETYIVKEIQKNMLYRYYSIARENNFFRLMQLTKVNMKKKKISLWEWYITNIKKKIKNCNRGNKI